MWIAAALKFFSGDVGKLVAIGFAVLAWTAVQRTTAANRARAECRAAQIEQTLKETLRQRDAARMALDAAEVRAVATAAEMTELEKKANAIVVEKPGVCAVPADAVRRLRDIK